MIFDQERTESESEEDEIVEVTLPDIHSIVVAMACVVCDDQAIRVYRGDSLCEEHFALIKQKEPAL